MIERLQADNTAAEQHVEARHRAGTVAHEDTDRLSSRARLLAGRRNDNVKDSGLPRLIRARGLATTTRRAQQQPCSRARQPTRPHAAW